MLRSGAPSQAVDTTFANPQRVTIRGYDGDAMEPFLSRDGKLLVFNNSNDPKVNTDLYWAERIDDVTFQFEGEIEGVNTPSLEGVASMDRDGVFYFISPRSYNETSSTIYRGRFSRGQVTGVELVPGVSLRRPGIVNFDAEISADGNTLYFVESKFKNGGPKTASILFARRTGDRFVRVDDSARIMRAINTSGLNYAPATTASELEIYFTRATPGGPAIYRSDRRNTSEPFGEPRRIAAVSGFVEGPTVSPDAKSVYYHKKENGRFVLYRITRTAGAAGASQP
jgi:Tol biopolymer transport system component